MCTLNLNLKFYVRYWLVNQGGQSSVTKCRLNLNFKILGQILVSHTLGGQSSLTMCRLNLNLKIIGEILVSHTRGGQLSLTMCRRNLNFKILGEILVGNTRGVNNLSPCAGKIWTWKFLVRSSSVIPGVHSSFTMCKLNLNSKILGEILVSHSRRVNHLWPCAN